MPALSELFRKAHGALNSFRGVNNTFIGQDGDIVYSKNNVCIHDVRKNEQMDVDDSIQHIPGYLTLQCQSDDILGVTLILQWLPNTTLEKNPKSIRSVSQKNQNLDDSNYKDTRLRNINNEGNFKKLGAYVQSSSSEDDNDGDDNNYDYDYDDNDDDDDDDDDGDRTQTDNTNDEHSPISENDINVEMNGDMITVTSVKRRPDLFETKEKSESLKLPTINVIPNTPVDPSTTDEKDTDSSSATTSGADEFSDKDDELILKSSSSDDFEFQNKDQCREKSSTESLHLNILQQYRDKCEHLCKITPEQFAITHNLMLENDSQFDDDGAVSVNGKSVIFHQKTLGVSLFSVNLGKMRSMRLFFTADDLTSGQFVIATWDSHYKILHFHHGGLDKLAQLLEQWSAIKTKAVKDGSPSPIPDRQFLVCQPKVSKTELDPEEGLYERVSWDFWKSYKNQDGSIDDSFTMRKAIYFATMDPTLRREAWPFLLRVYPWTSTFEQRETIRNDIFIEYQKIKKRRMNNAHKTTWISIESAIIKDVIRTDRRKPYFAGDNNPNIDTMKNILLNYATAYPEISYVQGMSDLLAPLLSTIHDESDTYWCFVGLMQHQTLFASASMDGRNVMDLNLKYLRELLKLFVPDFFMHIVSLGPDALELMFVHRWILLCYKREFPEADTLHIWEACWAHYRTSYFHLFIAVAIISIYGKDVIEQCLPNDEILLYFSSLAMHLDGAVVLKKARGLLYQFHRLDKLPCTLADLCESDTEQWDTNIPQRTFECTKIHGEKEPCPFAESN
uniref:Rab-GAP TBC domain-containing protein n=1 Tax=Setaria digitata TaxID=48799 RepID=A0A915PJB7_9BILA